MEQGPVLIITFQAQVVMVIKNQKGEVVEGDPVSDAGRLRAFSLGPLLGSSAVRDSSGGAPQSTPEQWVSVHPAGTSMNDTAAWG